MYTPFNPIKSTFEISFCGMKAIFNAAATLAMRERRVRRLRILVDKIEGKCAFQVDESGQSQPLNFRAGGNSAICAGRFIKRENLGGCKRMPLGWNEELQAFEMQLR